MNVADIQWCTPSYQQALELRHEVLRKPLKLKFTAEELDAEVTDWHFGGWVDDELVVVISARSISDQLVQLRQMAVAPAHQRSGHGIAFLAAVEDRLIARGIQQCELDARQTAVNFYLRCGYESVGEVFEKLSLPHQKMFKQFQTIGP